MGWHPKYPVILHNHLSIPKGMDFFWPAPEEIGVLLSAHSTLNKGDQWLGVPKKWWIVPAVGVLGFLMTFGVMRMQTFGILVDVICSLAVAGLSIGLVTLFVTWTETCTYVGERGLARCVRVDFVNLMWSQKVFLFADGVSLRKMERDIRRTRSLSSPGLGDVLLEGGHGRYLYTWISYRWMDAGGRCLFEAGGKYDKHTEMPSDAKSKYFAYAAERAWFAYRTEELRRQIEHRGTAIFNVTTDDWFEVGRETIKVVSGGVAQIVNVTEMERIVVHNGVFKFECPVAKYSFEFMEPSDAKLCIAALEQLAGIKFEREGESRGLF